MFRKISELLRSEGDWQRHFIQEDKNTTWKYGDFQKLLEQYLDLSNKIIVEIGVARGGHSLSLLTKYRSIEHMYGVDPYVSGYDGKDVFSHKSQREFDQLFNYVKAKLDFPKYTLLREFSVNAARRFENNSIDAIYIDGDHSYVGVKNDVESWKPKMKIEGIMVGDDYDWPSVKAALINCLPNHKPIGNNKWIWIVE